jgi:hypothetical protein
MFPLHNFTTGSKKKVPKMTTIGSHTLKTVITRAGTPKDPIITSVGLGDNGMQSVNLGESDQLLSRDGDNPLGTNDLDRNAHRFENTRYFQATPDSEDMDIHGLFEATGVVLTYAKDNVTDDGRESGNFGELTWGRSGKVTQEQYPEITQ